MKKAGPILVAELNPRLKERHLGHVDYTNQSQVLWTGLPLLAPYLKLYAEPAGEFVKMGLFPSPMRKVPPPIELLNELTTRTNLVYYDWEITQDRLPQVRSLSEFAFVISGSVPAGSEAPTQKWLDAVAPKLGNCGTAVTMTSPKELTIVRNSPIGFTAFELILIKRWIDSTEFPLSIKFERIALRRKTNAEPVAPAIPEGTNQPSNTAAC